VIAAAKRKKDSTQDAALLSKFKGEYPPSLLRVMAGEAAAGVGFHQIAMQIAITSNALAKKEDQMLALCEGLIQNHVSDGSRYNTPVKRKAELQRMFRYTADNVCYTYSKDAVKRLVPVDVLTPDLDGLVDATGMTQGNDNEDANGLLSGLFMTEGIHWRSEKPGYQNV
jgi:hypothetical protein